MKVLLAGHLAKPQILPLTRMIRTARPESEFGIFGSWLDESRTLDGDFPAHPVSPFAFSRRRAGARQTNAKPKSNPRPPTAPSAPPNYAQFVRAQFQLLARETAFRLDARRHRSAEQQVIGQYDVFNLHSVFPTLTMQRRRLVGSPVPMVVSLWGSDVLRSHDATTTRYVQQLLNRATLITYTTNLFKEATLAKYGRHLAGKLRETFFSADFELAKQIADTDKADARATLQQQFGFRDDQLVVCVGHNASPDNQHLPALESIANLPAAVRQRLFVLVPMTYCQTDPTHVENVRSQLASSNLSGRVLTEFIDRADLVQLRKGCDMLVYLPISDVFSATVSQALIGQQVVISGSWLPYDARRRAGFRFWEIDTVPQLANTLVSLLDDWPETVSAVQHNSATGLEFFAPERLGGQWADVYAEAIELERSAA